MVNSFGNEGINSWLDIFQYQWIIKKRAIQLSSLGRSSIPYRRSRCHAYEAQHRQIWFDIIRSALVGTRNYFCTHRAWCLVGAFYIALSTPIAIAVTPLPQKLPIYIRPAYLKPIDDAISFPSTPLSPISELPNLKPTITVPQNVIGGSHNIVPGCGDNFYSQFIYSHESGCDLGAVNSSSGACGIGQAYPCSKLTCGLDYNCQNAYFTDYANYAYGGWANAYSYWLAHNWW